MAIREEFPLRLTINRGEDYTFLLSESFTFSSVDPGGFEIASFSVPRDLPQVLRGMPIKLDCGMQVAWEGRVKEIQRSLGSKTLIQCEGNGAQLRDADLSMVFVDRDLTRWGEASRTRQINELTAGRGIVGPTIAPDPTSNLPAIVTGMDGPLTPVNPLAEAWYDAGPGNKIASIYYDYQPGHEAQDGAVNWHDLIFLSENADVTGALESTANLNGTGTTGTFAPATAYRFALIQQYYGGSGGAANQLFNGYWRNVATYGNHGLTKRGTAPQGFYTSDIVGWIAAQLPGIQAGVIPEAPFYTVPHAAYYTPVEAQQIVADMAKLVGYHWGVWESLSYMAGNPEPRLDFRPYPEQGEYTAWAWRQQCAQLDIREDLSSQYNAAQVTYTEASGNPAVVEVTVDNPILDDAGIARRIVSLNLGTSTAAAAAVYGELALVLLQQQARVVGTAVIEEPIQRRGGAQFAPWMLRAGLDRLRIPDLPSSDVWGVYNELPITRVECTANDSGSITTNVEFGQGKNLLEALTAELAQVASITS